MNMFQWGETIKAINFPASVLDLIMAKHKEMCNL